MALWKAASDFVAEVARPRPHFEHPRSLGEVQTVGQLFRRQDEPAQWKHQGGRHLVWKEPATEISLYDVNPFFPIHCVTPHSLLNVDWLIVDTLS